MSKISELLPIAGSRTDFNDLFVTVNLRQGDLGTKNITRRELVNAIQRENFGSLIITGGSISNAPITNSAITGGSITNTPISGGTITGSAILNGSIANTALTFIELSNSEIVNSSAMNLSIANSSITDSIISNSSAEFLTISSSEIMNSDFIGGSLSNTEITDGTATGLSLIDPNLDLTIDYAPYISDSDYFALKDVSTNQTVKITYAELQNEIARTLKKVSKVYVDSNVAVSGNGSYYKPYKSLDDTFELLQETTAPISISVMPGDYHTNGNLALPDNCSIVSTNGQYATNIIMNEGYEEENCFLVGSGCYVQGFAFKNQRVDSLDDPKKGFAIAFRPGALIVRSPYVRDCSQISNYRQQAIAAPLDPVNGNPLVGRGGGVLLADRSVLNQNSIFPYLLAFGATPRSPNGIGYCARNGAGINGISSISIFQRTAFYALDGGQITLNNSGTQFGDISMRAKGNTFVVEPYETDAELIENANLADEIYDDAEIIIEEMWNHLTANTGYIGYDGVKCKRDVGYILDGVSNDLVLGTNYWATVNGIAYRRAASSVVIDDQLLETSGAIEYLRTETVKLLAGANNSIDRVESVFDEIIDILENGIENADPLVFSNTGIDNHSYARIQLQSNRSFIVDELIDWIESTYPSLSYDEALCRRDTGFIVDALSHDLNYNTNIATILNAQAYFDGAVSQLPLEQREPTAAAISQLGVICSQIVTGSYTGQTISGSVATSSESSRCVELSNIIKTVILEDSLETLPAKIPPNRSWVEDEYLSSRSIILLNKALLQIATVKFVGGEYALLDETYTRRDAGFLLRSITYDILAGTQTGTRNFSAGFFDYKGGRVFTPTNTYDYEKCYRDTKFITEAVSYDMAFNSNFRSIIAALAYYRGNASGVITEPQKQLTIDAITELKTQYLSFLTDSASTSRATALFDMILNIFENGPEEAPAFSLIDPTAYDTGFFNARRLLLANRTFIQDELDAWIADTYPSLVYDEELCRRDVGYILDALRYDLTYGGNMETIVAGSAYFVGAVAQYGEDEKAPTIAAYEYLKTILEDILQGVAITPTSGNVTSQDISGTPGSVEAATFTNELLDDLVYIIQNDGTLPSRTLPSIDWVDSDIQNDFNEIATNSTIISNNTLEEINKQNKTLLGAFIESFDFMRDYILNNYTLTASEEAMILGLFDDIIKKTILGPKRLKFGSLIESLGHQFNLAGAGVNKNALPLNFRRVGKPLPASGSVLQQEGGRIRWSGADELNNQYFARGLRVNGRTGRLEGRPFTSSVRRLARRAANSRTFT